MYKIKLRRVGNSIGCTLPRELLGEMHVSEGDELVVTRDSDGFHVSAYDPDFADAMAAFEETRRAYRNSLRELGR